MLDVTMSVLIIFAATVLFGFWTSRTALLLHGSAEEITKILDKDLSMGRRLLSGFGQ
jgi:hypothetical protein